MNIRGVLALVLLGLALGGCENEDLQDIFMETYIIGLGAEPAAVNGAVVEIQEDFAEIFEFEPLHIFSEVNQGFSVELPIGLRETMESLDEVEWVFIDPPDNYSPDPGVDAPEFGDGEIPTGIEFIGGPAAHDLGDIEVAVVDTGIDLGHSELNVVGTYDAVGEAGGEDLGGDDGNGHGTHVAGTIGGLADGSGVVGVAPGVPLHAVRVLDSDGAGTIGDIIAGLEYVATQPGIRVVNLSLGGASDPSPPAPLSDAIEALEDMGVVVCIAAGNDGADTAGYIPAGYDRGVVVAAYDADGGTYNGFASFSNYGDEVDIAAPGVNITSTYPSSDHAALSGTSMATPHVAGAAAAYLALYPDATPTEVEDALLAAGEDGYDGQSGDFDGVPLLDLIDLLQ